MICTNNKTNSQMSISASLMGKLCKECMCARMNLFSDAITCFDNDEYRFASLEDTISEEDRVNAITNNIVKFTFGHKDYLHFKLEGCDKLFQPKRKNPYDKIDTAVNDAIEQYNKMVELFQQKKEDKTLQGIKPTSFMISKLDGKGIEWCIDMIITTLEKYHFAMYLQEARDYYNELLKLAFGSESYSVKIGVTENSKLYLTDNIARKRNKRVLLKVKEDNIQARKFLRKGLSSYLNNKQNNMKKIQKQEVAEQVIVKQQESENERVNFNVAQVANYLVTLLNPASESSRLLRIAKIDTATWLSNSTDGVVTCSMDDRFLTLVNKVSTVAVSIPVNNVDEQGMEAKITSALDFLLKTTQFASPNGLYMEAHGIQATTEIVHNNTDKKSGAKLKQQINALFLKEKDKLRRMAIEDGNPKHRMQTLWGQLYRICHKCGYKGRRSKNELLPLLDENNQKVFKEMYKFSA